MSRHLAADCGVRKLRGKRDAWIQLQYQEEHGAYIADDEGDEDPWTDSDFDFTSDSDSDLETKPLLAERAVVNGCQTREGHDATSDNMLLRDGDENEDDKKSDAGPLPKKRDTVGARVRQAPERYAALKKRPALSRLHIRNSLSSSVVTTDNSSALHLVGPRAVTGLQHSCTGDSNRMPLDNILSSPSSCKLDACDYLATRQGRVTVPTTTSNSDSPLTTTPCSSELMAAAVPVQMQLSAHAQVKKWIDENVVSFIRRVAKSVW